MDIALLVALIAATVSIIGWVVNYILNGFLDRKKAQRAANLLNIERQLENLYGPLTILLLESKRATKNLSDSLGRKFVFTGNETLEDDELKTWLFWVEKDFFPRNEKIKELILTNTHLIEGERIPASFVAFLDHFNSWKIDHLRWQIEGVKYSWHSRYNWPEEFEFDVISTFEKLKHKQADHLISK